MADGDQDSSGRPSFSAFWKLVKQKQKGKGKGKDKDSSQQQQQRQANQGADTVSGGSGVDPSPSPPHEPGGQSPPGKEHAAKDKAQIRRAQVRKAQIQHRQRKANYVKQLELDVSQLRDMVTQAQQETAALMRENDGIREILQTTEVNPHQHHPLPQPDSSGYPPITTTAPGTVFGGPSQADTQEWLSGQQLSNLDLNLQPPPATSEAEMFGNVNIDDITVSLSMSELLGTPCFAISSHSSSASVQSYGSPSPGLEAGDPPLVPPIITSQQEQCAVNFILALEYVCWDHFSITDFHHHHPNHSEESGNHTLMATAVCMNSAPESIFAARQAFSDFSAASAQPSATLPLPPPPPAFEWQTTGITLDSLYPLTQFHPDLVDLTPVQAWFELASKYPLAMLFADGVLDMLLFELKSFVRCVVYGAAINRLEFDGIVMRVLGSPATSGGFGSTVLA